MLHQIGSGVLGPVYRTYEPQVDRLVAVKAFRLELVPEDVTRLADALRRMAASPTTHPGVVRVLDAGLEGTLPFVAMEYASGESLDVAQRDFKPGLASAMPVLIDIARAIDAAWAEGRGHGALHPRDVIVSPGADTRVTGFGIVSALESIGARAPVRRPYTAPERAAGEDWDIRADVYSLGAIAHELLSGRRPLGSGEQDGTIAPELPPDGRVNVRRVVGAALAERPLERYATASAFVDALEAVARGEAPKLPEKTAQKPTSDHVMPTPRTWHPPSEDLRPSMTVPARASEPTENLVRPHLHPDEPVSENEKEDIKVDWPRPVEGTKAAMAMVADADERSGSLHPAADIAPTDKPDVQFPSESRVPAPAPAAPESLLMAVPTGGVLFKTVEPSTLESSVEDPAPIVEEPRTAPVVAAIPVEPPAPPTPRNWSNTPASSAPPAGGTRITTIGLGASQPMFSTRNTALDTTPSFPWAAFAAVAAACLVVGGVVGYSYGVRRVETVASSVTTSAPGSRSTTDVPVTSDPAPKPTPPAPATESRPASPTAAAEKPDDRPATAATRVADVRGRIVVRSTPSGAIVRIDGRLQGETPVTVRDLTLGAHTLQVARPGFVPYSDRVMLSRATPSQTVTVQLEQGSDSPQATAGSVFVDSRPRGARVTLDGRDAGVTPLQIPEVTLGRHTVALELAGYKGISTEVMVRPGPTAKVAITLEQIR